MTRDLVVIGGGGFGRETLDTVDAAVDAGSPLRLRGVVDANPTPLTLERLAARGAAFVGRSWAEHLDAAFLVAVGDPAVRRRLVDEITAARGRFASVVHPAATVGSAITLGEGVIVCAGAAISTNVRMGDHVHVNPNATIGHDAVLEPFVSVNPGAIVSGEVLVGEGVLIGAGAVVLQGLTIGEGAVVGAAGCVVRDVPPRTIVKGVPAR